MSGTSFSLELRPHVPPELQRLQELAGDLYFSWDRYTRGLFQYLDPVLWEECRHNPKVFLRRVSQKRLEDASHDRAFLEEYERTLANYDLYRRDPEHLRRTHTLDRELIAYFCAEFGLHESLPVYSGGLGILAGDLCKAASDMGLPFVAVGHFYRAGNFIQTIDDDGNQHMHALPVDPDDLPMTLVRDTEGRELTVSVELPGRTVKLRAWCARAGHTSLYLLDPDVPDNSEADRAISQQLYPADKELRLSQEILLGFGGVRMLRAMGLNPSVWHINEGHPCLLLLERCRELVLGGMEFHAALEAVAAATVFTTHTPVTAGHEVYDEELILRYFRAIIGELGVSEEAFLALGGNSRQKGFNLTTFALRCARYYNGVSRIHRRVAAELEKHIWPEISVAENPFEAVTNGVHVPTFLAPNWLGVLDDPGWQNELLNPEYWKKRIEAIPDPTFWSVRLALKRALLDDCRKRVQTRRRRHGHSDAQIEAATELLIRNSDVMVIGFARRFATYKRATLLLDDPDRLARLLHDPDRPLLIIFAGRAHPNDQPGQELIRRIHAFSMDPRFLGRIILLEGYDIALARRLVAGVDVWLNVPEYPMEASGTSGMKAAINGAINFSILDGWWGEGYQGNNGWGLQPHVFETDMETRRRLEAQELLDTLEQRVLPLYFDKTMGYSPGWVRMAKQSMQSVIPRFNAQRMVTDYIDKFYVASIEMTHRLQANGGAGATELAAWKRKVRECWPGVSLRRLGESAAAIHQGDKFKVRVAVKLNGLRREDLMVECLAGRTSDHGEFTMKTRHVLPPVGEQDGEAIYESALVLGLSGLVTYKLRAYPYHPMLCRRFEMGFMKWI